MPATRMPDPSFWIGRRVFLTGHTGFKGTWLSCWLTSMGASVCGYALQPDTQPNMFEALAMADRVEHRIGDIRDFGLLSAVVGEFQPELIFHLAAQPLVRESYRDPVGTYATNVMGTVHLLEAARNSPAVRAVVVASSDKCYENREWIWGYRETDPVGGHDPYSSSKACTEIVTAAYRSAFFPPDRLGDHGVIVGSVRAGNVLGGGDWSEDRLVPDAVRAFCSGRPLQVRSPTATRPWQHVLEPLGGYLLLAERALQGDPTVASPWNFGPEDEALTVATVAEQLTKRWGRNARWEISPSPAGPHEARSLLLSSSKARAELGWHPAIPLPECLDMTVQWYQSFYDGTTPDQLHDLTTRQIGRYRAAE